MILLYAIAVIGAIGCASFVGYVAWLRRWRSRHKVELKLHFEVFINTLLAQSERSREEFCGKDLEKVRMLEKQVARRLLELDKIIVMPMWLFRLQQFVRPYQKKITSSIWKPPGSALRTMAEFVFSNKAFQRVYKPLLDDLEFEYIEALAQGKPAKARWIWCRGIAAFWSTALFHASTSIVARAARLIVGV